MTQSTVSADFSLNQRLPRPPGSYALRRSFAMTPSCPAASACARNSRAVERFLSRGRLLLADDMGLGKTAQAIAACHALWHAGRVRRGLLVVPAALKPQWLREWRLFTDAPAAVIRS